MDPIKKTYENDVVAFGFGVPPKDYQWPSENFPKAPLDVYHKLAQ